MTSVLSLAALLRGVGSKLRAGRRRGRKPAAAGGAVYAEVLEQRCLLSAYVVTDLSILAGGEGGATAINDAGQVIGSYTGEDWTQHAFLYSDGVVNDMNLGGAASEAVAINASGQVVGRYEMTDGMHAFVYDPATDFLSDLGNFGGTSVQVTAINDAGHVIGSYTDGSGEHAFLYSGGVMTSLGLGGLYSVATAINDAGDVIGTAHVADASAPGGIANHAYLYSGGVTQDLGTLAGDIYSSAVAINDDGLVVGTSSTSITGVGASRAFLYDGQEMIDLGTLGGTVTKPTAVNAAGQVIGWSKTAEGIERGFLYSDGMMTGLSLGGGYSVAAAINDAGQVVGGSYTADEQFHAFLYDGEMIDLTTLGDLGTFSSADAINASGDVAGWFDAADGTTHAFAYRAGEMIDLGGMGGPGMQIAGINAGGQVIGQGALYEWGPSHAFLASPPPATPVDGDGPVTTVATPSPAPVGTLITLSATVSDIGKGDSALASVEYRLDGEVTWTVTNVTSGLSTASFDLTLPSLAAGTYTVHVRGTDAAGNVGAEVTELLAVYDPNAGFVTGAGAIDTSEGTARFAFVAKYSNGATTPVGKTQFTLKSEDLKFQSTSYDWLVVQDGSGVARCTGSGTINGLGDYAFMITVIDGDVAGGDGVDRFRIQIWDKVSGDVKYDSQPAGEDDPSALTKGNIVLHD